jgi:hypothetical protein
MAPGRRSSAVSAARTVRMAGRVMATAAQVRPWRLNIDGATGHDAYAFAPRPPADDLFLFNAGRLRQAWRTLPGAQPADAQWHCRRVLSRLGSKCRACFGGRRLQSAGMAACTRWQRSGASGVWELFIPGAACRCALPVRDSHAATGEAAPGQERPLRAGLRVPTGDGLPRPDAPSAHVWNDDAWMQAHAKRATGCMPR